jgi:hypothetical protein
MLKLLDADCTRRTISRWETLTFNSSSTLLVPTSITPTGEMAKQILEFSDWMATDEISKLKNIGATLLSTAGEKPRDVTFQSGVSRSLTRLEPFRRTVCRYHDV